ncbi:MAG: 50S ribosomal protein L13 [Candidatus Omnitrophica bacterium]|nr:50S ribosomal protein L13 [Candidatus Omnitrophota bacterium]MDD5080799.1 50S ribosomal protein L13 [Candidatus Omnitrophota bacterium]MDD5440916.1 50S ribosomal protein L13 [Candidatus Omnitrophota bacterium]
MKTTKFFNNEAREWVLIDAKDKVLGRLSTRIAKILQGKDKPTYTPNALVGDKVIVINADRVRLTGRKVNQKIYDKYTGYPGGRREITYKELREKNPTKVLYESVSGMLPKNWLGKQMKKSLKIYAGEQHDHIAQNPTVKEV